MGDEEVGGPEPVLEVGEEVEDGRLDRDVEPRGDLVADHQLGPGAERARDGHALLLAPRQLVGTAAGVAGRQPHLLEEPGHPFVQLPCRRDLS